jgi:hypothetical protein
LAPYEKPTIFSEIDNQKLDACVSPILAKSKLSQYEKINPILEVEEVQDTLPEAEVQESYFITEKPADIIELLDKRI